jgi:hypothetical protein
MAHDGSGSHAHVHIAIAIETLLRAHSSACMYRSNGHPGYLESVKPNLEQAMQLINAAVKEVDRELTP